MKRGPLYILRHAETTWNAAGRLQGRFDAPLTARGVRQARAQARILRRLDLDGFQAVTSPQGRAVKSASIALQPKGILPQVHPALREIGLGDWAGRDRSALMAETGATDGFALYSLAPDGEGFEALARRCQRFLSGVKRPAVIVTHGVTSRMLRVILTGADLSALPNIGGGQGVVYRVANGVQTRIDAR